jgi:hypothetical protein
MCRHFTVKIKIAYRRRYIEPAQPTGRSSAETPALCPDAALSRALTRGEKHQIICQSQKSHRRIANIQRGQMWAYYDEEMALYD